MKKIIIISILLLILNVNALDFDDYPIINITTTKQLDLYFEEDGLMIKKDVLPIGDYQIKGEFTNNDNVYYAIDNNRFIINDGIIVNENVDNYQSIINDIKLLNTVNIYQGPSTLYDVIGQIDANEELIVTGFYGHNSELKNYDYQWLYINYNDISGYIKGDDVVYHVETREYYSYLDYLYYYDNNSYQQLWLDVMQKLKSDYLINIDDHSYLLFNINDNDYLIDSYTLLSNVNEDYNLNQKLVLYDIDSIEDNNLIIEDTGLKIDGEVSIKYQIGNQNNKYLYVVKDNIEGFIKYDANIIKNINIVNNFEKENIDSNNIPVLLVMFIGVILLFGVLKFKK